MEGQISMFDYLPKSPMERFWDRDISYLCILLDDWRKKYNLVQTEDPVFLIWEHVPYLGYRLEYGIELTRSDIKNKSIWEDLERIMDEAESCRIELSPQVKALQFYEDEDTSTLWIYSMFEDAKRRKVK